jgi:hypothetical protein
MEFRMNPIHPQHGPQLKASRWNRRDFMLATGAAAAGLSWNGLSQAVQEQLARAPETLVKLLFESFTPSQRDTVCFDWDHVAPGRGLLRTRVENNWKITNPTIASEFFTPAQQSLVREIFEGIIEPDWHARFDKQLTDDMGGFGKGQSLAIFGTPGSDRCEFVLTGRHTTLRCDGNTQEHVALGGPIFYGHAAGSDDEGADHPGNVFWEQALAANSVYQLLDGRQRRLAEVSETPSEDAVAFRKDGRFQGIPVSEFSRDQREAMQQVLLKLIEPFRTSDRAEVQACLEKQGGIEKLHFAVYTDEDAGDDQVWDNWRLEGPSFVWHFRGYPHVHVWVNIADSPNVALNA